MPSCWTCGAPTQTASHRCPECKTVVALDAIENKLEAGFQGEQLRDLAGMSTQFAQIAIQKAQWQAMNELAEATNRGFRRVCDAIRWSTTEISWRLDQQQETLKSIDNTLKTPSETQANEFRQMAERLVERGVLEDAREFYEKALNLNRLDYRTYVGLAEVLVKKNSIARAIEVLTRSLPHAPKAKGDDPIRDYRSYSLRLIARGQECLGNLPQAEKSLKQAVELSPEYHDARYDFARLNCLLGNEDQFTQQLILVIKAQPLYWHFAFTDASLRRCESGLSRVLQGALTEKCAIVVGNARFLEAYSDNAIQLADSYSQEYMPVFDSFNAISQLQRLAVICAAPGLPRDVSDAIHDVNIDLQKIKRHRVNGESWLNLATQLETTMNYAEMCDLALKSAEEVRGIGSGVVDDLNGNSVVASPVLKDKLCTALTKSHRLEKAIEFSLPIIVVSSCLIMAILILAFFISISNP